jgi:hypothetical protein
MGGSSHTHIISEYFYKMENFVRQIYQRVVGEEGVDTEGPGDCDGLVGGGGCGMDMLRGWQ